VSELSTVPASPQKAAEDPRHVIEGVSHSPVFISEQTVAFGTAAAVPFARTKPNRGVIAALRAMFPSPPEDARPTPRHYPPRRAAFLEEAAMERETHRL
jgi:hypothetical protein